MCNDEPVPAALSRRGFIRAAGAAAAGGWLLGRTGWAVPAHASAGDGTFPYSMAMHIHTSFSEQSGSMDAQLFQAQRNGIDVLWLTDHDYRMLTLGYRQVVHFTSLDAESTDGPPWKWTQQASGSLLSSSGAIVASPASPNDTISGGSLALTAQSTSSSPAAFGFWADSHPAGGVGREYQCNIYGQTLTIEVLPTEVAAGGYLELLITTSYHQAKGGRPPGLYSLSYRFGGRGVPGSRVANGVKGIITVPVNVNQWNTVSITPSDDIGVLWPDMQAHDFASWKLTLSAVSTGRKVSGYFDYLRFARQYNTGNLPILAQQQMMTAYSSAYPRVVQHQGLEISGFYPHVNWFGGAVTLGNYSGITKDNYPAFLRQEVARIHARGGVASYNHPYGASAGSVLPTTTQDSLLTQAAGALLANNLLDCDLMEVGYVARGGCDLAHHLGLWDVLSRNARFVTGNGVNDDHFGRNWSSIVNNWYTSVWAASRAESDLVAALRAGRAWSASLSRFRGSLDLVADGSCPMGSASISQVSQRQLRLLGTGLPSGGNVQVVRGEVDYTGTVPNATVVAAYSSSSFAGGSATCTVDTSTSCFVRMQVLDSTGRMVAVSNPIWLLREMPPNGVPLSRAC